MAGQRETDEHVQGTTGTVLKRRGILAAAAVVVVGIAARHVSEPVQAATGGTQGTALILGANNTNGTANTSTQTTVILNGNATLGSFNGVDAFTAVAPVGGVAVAGYATAAAGFGGIGVVGGFANGTVQSSVGVLGGVNAGTAVSGQAGGDSSANTTGFPMGVRGSVADTGYGIYGRAGNGTGATGAATGPGGNGVHGTAVGGIGVLGESVGGTAVQGIIGAGSAPGTVAINAQNRSTAANSHALTAVAAAGHGLVGSSNGGNTYAGLVGNAGPNGARAGAFYGDVVFSANFYVLGNQTVYGAKSAALPHTDGSHRLVYCEESSESWLTDYGKGTLVNGAATVKVDADFAAVADMTDYHVFLTVYGASQGLDVASQSATSFVVQERSKGTSTARFSYRVVAKRKDVKAGRLARVAKPVMAPLHLPDPPPDMPDTPVPAPAPRQPATGASAVAPVGASPSTPGTAPATKVDVPAPAPPGR